MQFNSPEGLSWYQLQDALRKCETEEQVLDLMAAERAGRGRLRWMMRIHGKFKVLRAEREAREILAAAKEK